MRTPVSSRPRRALAALAAGAVLATGAAACEPPEPAAFTIATTATGPDAAPGDGICATAQGVCSLQAAVEEANALDRQTTITVPDGVAPAADLTVTGVVHVVSGGGYARLGSVDWTVAEGAHLSVTDADIGVVVVGGAFVSRRVTLGFDGAGDPIDGVSGLIQVSATGTALLTNSQSNAWGVPLATNAGALVIHGTTVAAGWDGGPTITTATGGQTRLSATAFLGGAEGIQTCSGVAPISHGYNLAPDSSCGLVMDGDRQDLTRSDIYPVGPDDPRVDAIPVGTLSCGAGWSDDITGASVRPFDGDEDGTAACDIGTRELAWA